MLRTSLLSLLIALPLSAQTSSKPSGVTLRVPVLVREKKGAPVTNVTKEDLTLAEDSQPQTILSLVPNSGEPLTFGILVDTSPGQRAFTAEEKAASQSFIETVMRAGAAQKGASKGFVVHFDRQVELLADLSPAEDKVQHGATLLDSPVPTAVGDEPGSAGGQALLYDAIFLATDEITGKKNGRKALVIFSSGIDRGSKETLRSVIDTAQRSGTTLYAVYVKGDKTGQENKRQRGDQGPSVGYPGGGYPGGGYPGGGYPGGGYPGGGYPGGGYPGGGYPGGYPNDPNSGPRPLPTTKIDGKRILADIVTPTGGRIFELSKKETAAQIYAMIADDLAHQSVVTFMPDKAGARPGFHSLRIESKRKDTSAEAPDGFYIPEP